MSGCLQAKAAVIFPPPGFDWDRGDTEIDSAVDQLFLHNKEVERSLWEKLWEAVSSWRPWRSWWRTVRGFMQATYSFDGAARVFQAAFGKDT